ncbi:uncharacterized protein [Anoplolepis gracilipes]|uniref:uncharacterized protein n=1 Tax=Anoplolepis gracilipes TaxID=354296 RepID=UPI003B9FEDE0
MDKITINPAESIPTFYAGQSIFLTGATGFLGKVYMEKILRFCPDVREVFILMRSKKGIGINERLEKILNLPLYDKLREEQPSNFKKLIPILGDVSEENLGLSATDRQMLAERVTIVIHASANVRFTDSLKYAIFTNTRSTRDICILAQSMKNLIALVYVSTAYAHVNQSITEEKIYPPLVDWRKMIKAAESLDEHILNIFTAKCLDKLPNTYIFSKNLAETIITEYSSTLPCAIVRPSIVASSYDDPIPGWIDNFNGPLGILVGGGKGILRVCQTNKHVCIDVVPVDIVIKCIIATTWHLGLSIFTPGSAPLIINCTTSNYKSLSTEVVTKMGFQLIEEIPFEGTIWTPNTILTDSTTVHYILTILLHILPAMLIDLILMLTGHQPMLLRLQRKVYVANCFLKHFTCHQWQFKNTNGLKLHNLIPLKDKEVFSLEINTVDSKKYYRDGIIGVKLYLLNEDMNRLDEARTHRKRLDLFVATLKTIIIITVLWIMYKWIFLILYLFYQKQLRLNMTNDAADTFIPAFYAHRSILISGSTGFLGKVLCEKLLRSCPDVAEIFLLIRPKKGLSVQQRLQKTLENKLFDVLRNERPSAFNKLIPIIGDVSLEGLGLLPSDRQILIEKVSVIFHVAASVRFDESLRDAIFNNTRSTRDICILGQKMKKLVVLLHVSSTYTQADKSVVDETLYPSELDWRQAIKVAESVDEHTLRTFTAKYLGTMPNTYTFTKRLAEDIIRDYSKTLPCLIIRPSIVVSTVTDPMPGWIDNFNGPIGMLVGGGKGVLRVLYVDPMITSDFIPVDVAIKAMIIVAWKRGLKPIIENDTIHIYNCSSYDKKCINIKNLVEMGFQITKEIPLDYLIWSPSTMIIRSRFFYYIMMLMLHILPALFIDGILKLFGARPILLKLQKKVYCANSALSYFLTNQWKFHNEKLINLFENLSPENNKHFGFEYRELNIEEYFRNGLIGAKIYLLKEDMNQLEAAKLHRKRMDWLHRITMTLFFILVLWILYRNVITYVKERERERERTKRLKNARENS